MRLAQALLACVGLLRPGGCARAALPSDVAAWKRRPLTELRIRERDREIVYLGVPLCAVLGERVKPASDAGAMKALRGLSDAVILVQAQDGYQAAYSAAAVAMDPKGE